jgi:diaminopimelate decarboxylase
VIELFPASAEVVEGELWLGGLRATALADRFGTPLVVLCERTIRERAAAFRDAVPGAAIFYGTKAFPNVAVMRLLRGEGLGADVSTLGELGFARATGLDGERLVVHGNNKSDEELRAAAAAGATVVLDALGEAARAAAAGVRRVLVRVTPGVEADTHAAIRTGHHGSKFGLPPDDLAAAVEEARAAGLEVAGLHLHVGSQLADSSSHTAAVGLVADAAASIRERTGWTAAILDCGGGFGVRHVPEEPEVDAPGLLPGIAAAVRGAWSERGLPEPRLAFEPGRSLVGPAGVTLYRVGVVKRAAAGLPWVAVDGGMSDNPRPQLYGARYTALLAGRADVQPSGAFAIAGKHCESGDVLIESVELPEPRPGDVLAVPVTGAYTLGMASNYNGVPRPAAVLVADGEARLARRRETVDDLLALEPDA